MGINRWHGWLLSTIVPSLFVVFHFLSLTGDDARLIDETSLPLGAPFTAPLRSFIDPVWAEWGSEESQYESLVPPSEIDHGISNRLAWRQQATAASSLRGGEPADSAGDSAGDKCGDILLFMPQMFARNGHGSQLNSYLLAAMVATFMDKAMVLLEAPQKHSKYPNGSQFGCPVEAFANAEEFLNFKGNDHSKLEMRRDFPRGLKRLIDHPTWISRDCGIPECNTFVYESWDAIRKAQRDYYSSGLAPREIKCEEKREKGTAKVRVTVMGGEEVRQYFDRQFKKQMLDRSTSGARQKAYDWAVRLGATDYQARVFSKTSKESDIWDYMSALLARSGLVTFQPWIARDVKEFIRTSNLPLDQPHDAIHVRRGDKLETEAREEVVNYWHSQGYERQVDFPFNYIPFSHYLRLWETDCQDVWNDHFNSKRPVRTIYLATDDPDTVKKEIAKLPRGQGGTTIVGGCERVKFVFSPDAQHKSYHIGDGGFKVDCVERYKRNIHSIADLMILTKSNTFVGEFTSNWGRIVRIFRTQLNDMYVLPDDSFRWRDLFGLSQNDRRLPKSEPLVLLHDTRIAFAENKRVPPPGW